MNEILESVLENAERHALRLRIIQKKLQSYTPFTEEFFTQLTEEKILLIDSFVHRFAMLQDLMGSKLFDLVLDIAQEPIKGSGFLDKLDALERLSILEEASVWQKLRNIRNHLAHEYPDQPELMAQYLNEAMDAANTLLNILSRIQAYIRQHPSVAEAPLTKP